MQNLWGRILAGEVKQPQSFSLRTLEFLKNLSKNEAEVFTKFCQAKVVCIDKHLVYNPDNGKFLEEEFNISYTDILLLAELGLILTENNLEYAFFETKQKVNNAIQYGDKAVILYRPENTPRQAMEVLVFTKIGMELSSLISQEVNLNYIKKLCAKFKTESVKVEYGDYIRFPDNHFKLLNKTEYNE